MKKNKFKSKKTVKELAEHFDIELNSKLPIKMLPNGAVLYKGYIVKKESNENWGVYNVYTKDLIEQFFLKSCALLAAKAHAHVKIEEFFEVKRLDNRYWASYCDMLVYKHNIKNTPNFERYLILLNKLEHSTALTEHFKEEISRMFKWRFV